MTIEEYLQDSSVIRKNRLEQIIHTIKTLYPTARESMRHKMPTFESSEGWVAVANQKHYISVYTCSAQHIDAFKLKHPTIKTGRGCINFKDKDEIPLKDLQIIIKSAMEFRHT
ncbi:hypothetical protein CW748_04025 [Alteromonadales bacterium alter-6D02]|nr:hypothetical protein CW748_04025 [Alteromonadales bacterium alter-6D02]